MSSLHNPLALLSPLFPKMRLLFLLHSVCKLPQKVSFWLSSKSFTSFSESLRKKLLKKWLDFLCRFSTTVFYYSSAMTTPLKEVECITTKAITRQLAAEHLLLAYKWGWRKPYHDFWGFPHHAWQYDSTFKQMFPLPKKAYQQVRKVYLKMSALGVNWTQHSLRTQISIISR